MPAEIYRGEVHGADYSLNPLIDKVDAKTLDGWQREFKIRVSIYVRLTASRHDETAAGGIGLGHVIQHDSARNSAAAFKSSGSG
jgi:hypothetical protein